MRPAENLRSPQTTFFVGNGRFINPIASGRNFSSSSASIFLKEINDDRCSVVAPTRQAPKELCARLLVQQCLVPYFLQDPHNFLKIFNWPNLTVPLTIHCVPDAPDFGTNITRSLQISTNGRFS